MAEPLLYDEITPQQRTALAALTRHPGFEVLVLIFNKSCERINSRMVKVNPDDPEYEKKLTRQHLCSRTVNEFCAEVLKSIAFHEQVATVQAQMTEEEIRAAIQDIATQSKPGNPLALAVKSNVGDKNNGNSTS